LATVRLMAVNKLLEKVCRLVTRKRPMLNSTYQTG